MSIVGNINKLTEMILKRQLEELGSLGLWCSQVGQSES